MEDTTQLLVNRSFDSFAELSDLASGWGTEFRQLRVEKFSPQIFQGRLSSLLLTNARFGCQVDQRGTTPPGMRTFALPNSGCTEFRWFGHTVSANSLLLFPIHGEIECVSRPGFSVFTFSIPVELLEQNIHFCNIFGPGNTLTPSEMVVRLDEKRVEPMRNLLRLAQWLATTSSQAAYNNEYYEGIQNQIVLCMLELFSLDANIATTPTTKKQVAIKKVLDFVEANKHKPLRVPELCSETDISLRSLQLLFKQEIGMTLKAYVTAQRLYGAHRDLWGATQLGASISDVAAKWGFWHMSQFSKDYRTIFDELPSDTLSRNTDRGSDGIGNLTN
ncbi:AraC family transcriptional regulator [Halieaceae bacterium IMCC14734]|uniref:AraC family transcriptional regulator n=1 Tax=Candidatus Litorirhabdus singularis TaxID=2518993 RepID=A0ABT3TM67_9GAMM|nr:helix-turn-helix domain-containing protein [Candidatus Litorirhabdus singularis]MCX2983422.1 AraC family transcriptional regulator [Candidatus Litorirhabdus singularis]